MTDRNRGSPTLVERHGVRISTRSIYSATDPAHVRAGGPRRAQRGSAPERQPAEDETTANTSRC